MSNKDELEGAGYDSAFNSVIKSNNATFKAKERIFPHSKLAAGLSITKPLRVPSTRLRSGSKVSNESVFD